MSALAREHGLWSLEFAFDEDDGRIARIEARFWDPRIATPADGALPGYELQLVIPARIPLLTPADRKKAYEQAVARVVKDRPIIYLYHRNWLWAYSPKLSGVRNVPDGLLRVTGVKMATAP